MLSAGPPADLRSGGEVAGKPVASSLPSLGQVTLMATESWCVASLHHVSEKLSHLPAVTQAEKAELGGNPEACGPGLTTRCPLSLKPPDLPPEVESLVHLLCKAPKQGPQISL